MPGIVIVDLDPNGRAAKAGLRQHDCIYKYNDTVLMDTSGLIAATQTGRTENILTVIRRKEVLQISVSAGSMGVTVQPFPIPDIHIEGVGEVIKSFANQDEQKIIAQVQAEQEAYLDTLANIQVTTAPSLEGYRVTQTIGIITSEHVEGINILVDFFAEIRDITGGRSRTLQSVLRHARQKCIAELRMEAHSIGANAVIGVDLDYSEISGGGKNMLFLVASGTAVFIEKNQ